MAARTMISPSERRQRYHDGEGRQPSLCAVCTHDEVARAMGISRQRMVQLEARALQKLRASAVMKELE
jgi:DNA-directed RNA polymerase sigma subunit (sigma70/sigma32)